MSNVEFKEVVRTDIDDDWSDLDDSLLLNCDIFEGQERASSQSLSPSQTDRDGERKPREIITNAPEIQTFTSLKEASAMQGDVTPMNLFSKGGYLCVTDFTQQLWCEQQLCYTLMGVEPQSLDDLPLPLPVCDRPEVKSGKSLHLARELEIYNIVNIQTSTKADKWVLYSLNLLTTILGFLAGVTIAREVPIFGDPFGTNDLVFGIIDELQFDAENYRLSLLELKTRKTEKMPGKIQQKQHFLQVQLYKQLWDNLVKGNFSVEFFLSKLNFTGSADDCLSEEVIRHIHKSAISATSLKELLSQIRTAAQALVCISSLEIEYVLQGTGALIGRICVKEDFNWLCGTFHHCMKFWHGQREPEGVDIEEAWKCQGCEFSDMCEWRIKKSKMLSSKRK